MESFQLKEKRKKLRVCAHARTHMYTCVCTQSTLLCAMAYMWWSEGNLLESVLSYHVDTRNQIQVIRLGGE